MTLMKLISADDLPLFTGFAASDGLISPAKPVGLSAIYPRLTPLGVMHFSPLRKVRMAFHECHYTHFTGRDI